MSWTKTTDAMPPMVTDWLRDTSFDVLVTDGKEIIMAYAVHDFGDPDEEVRWYATGRDSYWLTFTPTHWHMLPVLP